MRKGQWTDEGCTPADGAIAFKRAYKDDSYALVALNGGATFTDCPDGTYTDVVTGKTYTGTTITVDAPATQGQLRVLVKDWKGGKVGEDGPFIYDECLSSQVGITVELLAECLLTEVTGVVEHDVEDDLDALFVG